MKIAPLLTAGLAMSLAATAETAASEEANEVPTKKVVVQKAMPGVKKAHLKPGNTIGDVFSHPAFAGFSRLILPWDDRAYDLDLPLEKMGLLLPYHSHVDPRVVVQGLNRMIDDVDAGQPVFLDIYSSAEKQREPTKANAGLFFFRGEPGAPFAIVAPGGGFSYVGSVHEGFPYADEINRCGFNAFVIRYRPGFGGRAATEDLAAAITYVFQHAKELGVSLEGYSLWGSSAGARMAAAIGSHGVAGFGGADVAKPSAVVMAYTAHADHATSEPPTFALVGEQDGIAPAAAMRRRVETIRRLGTPVEFRVYPDLGHGFGPGTGTSAEGWIGEACRFWKNAISDDKR